MKSIELLVNEHKNIKRMLSVVKEVSYQIYEHKAVELDDFDLMIDFIRNYADKHHHEKEENILFDEMGKHLGEAIVDGPLLAMFSEHDLGRMYVSNLEEAVTAVKNGNDRKNIDIITNARAYADLLDRHIDKEDNTIYVFGENNLSEDSLMFVENEMTKVELEAEKNNIQKKYIDLLEQLEEKYL